MTKKRMLAAGAAVALTLGLSAGVVAAQSDSTRTPATTTTHMTGGMHSADMDAMHAQMRAQMPEDMQAQHGAMHAQMGAMNDMDGAQMGGAMTNGMMMGR